MGLLRNMRIGVKFFLVIIFALLSLSVVGLSNLSTMSKMNQSNTAMYEESLLRVKWLNQLISFSKESTANVLTIILSSDAAAQQKVLQRMDVVTSQTNKIMDTYKGSNLTAHEVEGLKKLDALTDKARAERKKTLDLAQQNKREEAFAAYTQTYYPILQERFDLIQELATFNEKKADDLNVYNIKQFNDARTTSILILTISLLVCMATGYLITRLVTKPIRAMQHLMEQAASGDLQVSGSYVSKDEMGLLTQSFNSMIDGLRNLMRKINDNSLSLSAMSEELSASAEQAGDASTQINGAIQEVAAGVEKQTDHVKATERAIEQMSAGVHQISNYTETASNKAALAAKSAIEGKNTIEKSVLQMESIQLSVGNASRSIIELGVQAQHIGQIVESIQGIANQTNLLALNAAIEAARVGEQGRGFAVVATEIRKLSEQSSTSAQQITDYIESVKAKITTAVEGMEVGTKEVASGAVGINEVNRSFDLIFDSINEVTSHIQGVSASAQQIAVGTEEVVQSFSVVSDVAFLSMQQTQTVSSSTEEQLATIEEMSSSSNALANMAEELQSYVGKFRID